MPTYAPTLRSLFLAVFAASIAMPLSAQPGGDRATSIKPGESCPPGTTEIRPRSCAAPQLPAPSILDYRPHSTLVAPVTMVKTAKYPAIDFHAHIQGLFSTTQGLDSLLKSMDELNLRLMVAADGISGDRLTRATTALQAYPKLKGRVVILTGISFQGVGPGWAEKAIAQLEADVKGGAVGVGEIGKGLGLNNRKPDGSRLHIDDPELDPIWDACARLNLPVFIHTADPQEFFQPLDFSNERWLEQALFPERRYPQEQYPSFETLMTERDNLFRKHPKTKFVTAHMGWHANDLGRLGKMFDEMPNLYAELGAVLYDIGRQPRVAHDF